MSLYQLHSKIGPTIVHEGNELLYFSGTSYLGIGTNKAFEELVISGIHQYGISHGLSRINNVRLAVYEQFETFFAERAGSEKSLALSSGYLAGQSAIQHLANRAEHILIAPDTHPAILPPYTSSKRNYEGTWKEHCIATCEQLPSQHILIVSNSVDPLTPEIHDFSWIAQLPRIHKYTLLLDDSHAFGTVGSTIFGTFNKWKYLPVELVVSGSLGKGLGIQAGIILGDQSTLLNISREALFRTSSPPSPAFLYAFLKAQEIYKEALETLKNNNRFFFNLIQNNKSLHGIVDYPVYTFKDRHWVKQLEEKGIVVSSFPYPDLTDPWTNRIIISAFHEEEDLLLLHKLISQLQHEPQYSLKT
jgi:8-amino-7-oxononanoate synthase